MKKNRIQILQPSIGKYRVGFYRQLVARLGSLFEILVLASESDSNGVKSVNSLGLGVQLINDIPYYSLFGGRLFWQPVLNKVWGLNNGDFLVINGNPRYLSNIVAAIIAKIRGARIIWWGHGWTAGGSELNANIRFFLMRFFDHVFLYTDGEVQRYKNRIGKNVSISALNNGIDVAEIRESINELKFSSDSFRIGFIGRLEQKSRLSILIRSVAALKKQKGLYDRLVVDVIGDGACLSEYKRLARVLDVEDKFEWHGAIWDSSVSNQLLTKCAFFVYPGQVGLSVVHAFSLGLPALVHDDLKEQMPEVDVIDDGLNGFFFKNGDPNDLAGKIEYLLSNRVALADMRCAAFNAVTDTFNTYDMAARFSQVVMNFDN